MKPQLSIIIPVYNDAENLNILLTSIFKNTFNNFEVIVVDDASSDMSVKKVAGQYKTRYVRHETNRCVAAARNTGAKQAKADILVFIDSDVLLEPDTLQRFHDAYEDMELQFYQPLCSKEASNAGFGPDLVALIWYFDYGNFTRFSLHSQAFSIKKELFFRHRGFDERFKGLGAEEFEFGYRLEKEIFLYSDKTHFLKQKYQTVFPRAISLFKRTVRYTVMFLFRTRKFEAQGGTPVAVFSAFLAFCFFVVVTCTAAFSIFAQIEAPYLYLFSVLLFFLHTAVNIKFFKFLLIEKGAIFSFKSLFAVFLWSMATGLGIFTGSMGFLYMIIFGKKYHTTLMEPFDSSAVINADGS